MNKNKCHCGNELLPTWFNSFLSFFHNKSCMKHDEGYFNQDGRLRTDFIFLINMFRTSMLMIFKGVVGIFLAPIMFIAIFSFGWITYNKIKNRPLE